MKTITITKQMAVECAQCALKHADDAAMKSSALLCLKDACSLIENGAYEYAYQRALKSLAYSVGKFSPEYTKYLPIDRA